ncbi:MULTISPECIES: cysteine hydrolase family protein [unclassified Ruegeria]|uniref:cysteine hydrolase family protein n=1 Tax=unclassified Ruegeria TaxID=2625375 RepID=UPI001491FD46|nr:MULTISPECIES: cysteine hydrolase [unclassified Ruegeria]NOD91132.1 isochorismatase family protein [Ruegeria sp. HKCCD4318]NOE16448.1 isochorismatase family protein [Ruegeria sp. HKCCD4318-2]NOG07398.1 cysteine hydrolase [Ruegeria sp. HKCCD4315]
MTTKSKQAKKLIEGRPALILIDIQKSTFIDDSEVRSIDNMPGYKERMIAARDLVDAAHDNNVPVIFVQEVHRPDQIDFGRELDGDEDIHCLEGDPRTEVAKDEMGYRKGDYIVPKRRYSAFFGTDFEILLRGLRVDTLLLCGGLTDVCVHYTFVDGHQSDYFCRVVEDCVGGSSFQAHEAALKAMEYLQTGAVQSREAVINAISSL